MKHLFAGLLVSGVFTAIIVTTILVWWFLTLFVGSEVAIGLTAVIILVLVFVTILDYVTEEKA